MLVLSRKVGEQVVIGNGIRLKVLALRGNQVRLGFEAPEEVLIRRAELCFEIPEPGLATGATHQAGATVAEPMEIKA